MKPYKYIVKENDYKGLNNIVNRFGFRNYREAGVKSVPSGNFDIIREGDEITLGNYNPEEVKTIEKNPVIVTSEDQKQVYKNNGDTINSFDVEAEKNREYQSQQTEQAKPEVKPKETTQETYDNIYDVAYGTDELERTEARTRMEKDKEDYMASITTKLSIIDDELSNRLKSIGTTWERRIEAQDRINKTIVGRTKAYGLAGGGIYKPKMYTGAVGLREEEAQRKIGELESLRDQEIASAKLAHKKGQNLLTDAKFKRIDSLEKQLKQTYRDLERESRLEYEKLLKKQKLAEDIQLKKIEEDKQKLSAFIYLNKDEWENLPENELQDKLKSVMFKQGISLPIGEALNAYQKGTAVDYKALKSQADIAKVKAQTNTEFQKAKTQAEKTRTEQSKQYKNYKDTTKTDKNDLSYTDAEKKRLRAEGILEASQEQTDAFLYDNENYDEKDYVTIEKGEKESKKKPLLSDLNFEI